MGGTIVAYGNERFSVRREGEAVRVYRGSMDPVDRFEAMLAGGQDGALLRFGLGMNYLRRGDPARAAGHLRRAVELDPDYSAAWKLLGKALAESGDTAAAVDAYRAGIAAAGRRGDKQAAREMTVFLGRLERPAGSV